MWLPKWLYDLIPYIYICAGFASIYFIDNVLSFISGCIFGWAGILVKSMRGYGYEIKKDKQSKED